MVQPSIHPFIQPVFTELLLIPDLEEAATSGWVLPASPSWGRGGQPGAARTSPGSSVRGRWPEQLILLGSGAGGRCGQLLLFTRKERGIVSSAPHLPGEGKKG